MAEPTERKEKPVCTWIGQHSALRHFAAYSGPTQSQAHIRPLHWYVACRLVIQGGFHPDNVTPHPPFRVEMRKNVPYLTYDPSVAKGNELTLLGGLKTKDVDVVVTLDTIGPVLSVSCKGMIGALRNITNRLEEAVGECTNLHITYPALVAGYLFAIRAYSQDHVTAGILLSESAGAGGRALQSNDLAWSAEGEPIEVLVRFHNGLRELSGRQGVRDDVSRYEATALALVDPWGAAQGDVSPVFPYPQSTVRLESFFPTLLRRYDERYVFGAPELARLTRRLAWAEDSPAFDQRLMGDFVGTELDYEPRLRDPE